MLTLTLIATKESMDFNRILDIEYKRHFNKLYFIYSLPGYLKNIYNPNKIANLVLMLAR